MNAKEMDCFARGALSFHIEDITRIGAKIGLEDQPAADTLKWLVSLSELWVMEAKE